MIPKLDLAWLLLRNIDLVYNWLMQWELGFGVFGHCTYNFYLGNIY